MEYPGSFERWHARQPHTYYFPKFEWRCRLVLWFLEDVAFFGILDKLGKLSIVIAVSSLAFRCS